MVNNACSNDKNLSFRSGQGSYTRSYTLPTNTKLKSTRYELSASKSTALSPMIITPTTSYVIFHATTYILHPCSLFPTKYQKNNRKKDPRKIGFPTLFPANNSSSCGNYFVTAPARARRLSVSFPLAHASASGSSSGDA